MHIWYTKRFFIGERWKCRIPLYWNGKGQRGMYLHRCSWQHGLMHNLAYYSHIIGIGEESHIRAMVQKFVPVIKRKIEMKNSRSILGMQGGSANCIHFIHSLD